MRDLLEVVKEPELLLAAARAGRGWIRHGLKRKGKRWQRRRLTAVLYAPSAVGWSGGHHLAALLLVEDTK
ncbi:hypothetical protein E2562_003272 [Oryza meyeriana var. granulata]|uniref:Uncharacterized protein n=1 Tax=Oryza meyeriana var. granulata TaxID=110450 RepID=A0A6G1ED43_9ORYZ|nr:hypothetical protein E2562_003272 [Oryza meyeriana var. granulata]